MLLTLGLSNQVVRVSRMHRWCSLIWFWGWTSHSDLSWINFHLKQSTTFRKASHYTVASSVMRNPSQSFANCSNIYNIWWTLQFTKLTLVCILNLFSSNFPVSTILGFCDLSISPICQRCYQSNRNMLLLWFILNNFQRYISLHHSRLPFSKYLYWALGFDSPDLALVICFRLSISP